jgi:hypothetical protein
MITHNKNDNNPLIVIIEIFQTILQELIWNFKKILDDRNAKLDSARDSIFKGWIIY